MSECSLEEQSIETLIDVYQKEKLETVGQGEKGNSRELKDLVSREQRC